MIDQLLCASIPDNCIAVCLVSGSSAVLLSKSGQCLIMGEDVDAMVRAPEDLKRVIVRGERATATTVSNLRPPVLVQLIEALIEISEGLPGKEASPVPVLLLDPDAPSPLARQMLEQIPEIERFARMLIRAQEPAPATSVEPGWSTALGIARAPRAAREALMEAIAEFGRQVNNQDLASQAQTVAEDLRTRDANIGQKRKAASP